MKIMFFTGGFEYGGAQRVICNLANVFSDTDDTVVVMASYAPPTYQLNDKVKLINGLKWKNYLDGIIKLRNCILSEKPDVLIGFAVQYNIASCLAALGTKTKVIVSERNDPKRMPKQKSLKMLRFITYRFADGFVFQTEDAQRYFASSIIKRSTIIANPLYLKDSIPEIKGRKKRIITASRYVPQKNLGLLIKSFSRVSAKFPDWSIDMYGDGDEIDNLRNLAKECGIIDKVRFNHATKKIHEVMRENSVFVLTSEFEGMPNSLMEAMGEGMTCISTDCPCGGPSFLIENDVNGFLFPVGDEKKLSILLDEILGNETKRLMMAKRAISIREKLDPESIMIEWKHYIRSIVNGKY